MAVKITYANKQPEPEAIDESLPTWRKLMKLSLPVLKKAGVNNVRIEFSGSGDSGQVDGVVFDGDWSDAAKIGETKMIAPLKSSKYVNGSYETTTDDAEQTLAEVLSEMAEKWAESTGVDWYNNDGGFGWVDLNMESDPPTFQTEISQYETTSEVMAGDEGEI